MIPKQKKMQGGKKTTTDEYASYTNKNNKNLANKAYLCVCVCIKYNLSVVYIKIERLI